MSSGDNDIELSIGITVKIDAMSPDDTAKGQRIQIEKDWTKDRALWLKATKNSLPTR